MHGKQPQGVVAWAAGEDVITRERIAAFKESLGVQSAHGNAAAVKAGRVPTDKAPRPHGPGEALPRDGASPSAQAELEPSPRRRA